MSEDVQNPFMDESRPEPVIEPVKPLAREFTLHLTPRRIFLLGIAIGALTVFVVGGVGLLLNAKVVKALAAGNTTGAAVVAPTAAEPEQPAAEPVKPVAAADHVRGDKNAAITIIEYSDFQCPFCSKFHATMKQVMTAYAGKVKWVYRHFPLASLHANAQKAAEASECAAEQGKFWEMADKMFENQNALDAAKLSDYAKAVGVKDLAKFGSCLSSGKYAKLVAADQDGGAAAGITGTPGSFVLDKSGQSQTIPGALPFESNKAGLDAMLAAK